MSGVSNTTSNATRQGRVKIQTAEPRTISRARRKDERRHKMRKGNWRRGMDRHSIIHGEGARLSERGALLYMALERRRRLRPPATAVSLFSTFRNVYGEQRVQRSSESTNDNVICEGLAFSQWQSVTAEQERTTSDGPVRADHPLSLAPFECICASWTRINPYWYRAARMSVKRR